MALALASLLLVLGLGSGTGSPPPTPVVDAELLSASSPTAPTGLRVVSGHRSLVASWTATDSGDNPRYYTVFVRQGSTLVASARTDDASTTSLAFSGLTNGQTYSVTVRVTTRTGFVFTTDHDSPESGAVQGDPRPSAPTGLSASGRDNAVVLTWNKNPERTDQVTKYSVYRGTTRVAQVATSSSSTTTYTDSGLQNGTAVSYAVTAVDANGTESSRTSTTATAVDTVAPAPVSQLQASGSTDGSGRVVLAWTRSGSADAATNVVRRDGQVVARLAASSAGWTDTTSAVDQTYSYSVGVVDDDGLTSSGDPSVQATPTDTVGPGKITGLRAVAGDGQVVLTWDPLPEPDAACTIVTTDGVDDYTCIPAATTTATVTGLTNDLQYRFTVVAHDTHGNYGVDSDPAYATPIDMTAPAVPTGLTAVRGDGQVSLTWNRNAESDLAGYDLFRKQAGASSAVRVSGAVLDASATSWTDTGLTNDVEYTYTLRARDRAGNSSASSAGVSATPTDLTPPAVPSRPSAVAGDGVVSLSWTANSETDLASYQVVRGGTVIATITGPTTTYDDRSVTNGTAYEYALTAVDTHGNASAASAPPVTATPRDLTPPAVPTGLTATRGDGQVALSWTANTESDLASYRVLRGSTVVATVTAPTTTFTDTGLVNDTEYSYYLAAYDAAGNGSASTPTAVKATPTDLTAPAAPTGVASAPGDRVVDVTWNANTEPDLASYRVYRDGQRVATITVVAAPGTTPTSYRDSGLTNGAAHTYAVTAVDTHGNESLTSTTSATPADTTAPGAASGLAAAPSDRQVALSWTASPAGDVATYRVLRDGVEVATVSASATSYTDSSLTNGRSYAYTVVAVDTAGNRSPATATATVVPRDGVAPGAPTGVSATPGSGSATVRWTPPADTDLATYAVLRADGSVARTVTAPATSAVVTGLTNGTTVTFTVRVTDTSGNTSPASASVSVRPAAAFTTQGSGTSGALAVSRDGRWVVLSTAADLPGDSGGLEELYRIDTTGAVAARRVAPLTSRGDPVTSSTQVSEVAVSDDGRYVVLATADKLVTTDTNGKLDVYRADMSTAPPTFALVSVPGTGARATARAVSSVAGTLLQDSGSVLARGPGLAVSADGTRVLFYSERTDLLPSTAAAPTGVQVYAKDLTGASPSAGPVTLVSSATGGGSTGRTPTGPALAVTPSGRYAFFTATTTATGYAVLRKDLGATTAGTASTDGELLLVSSTAPIAGEQKEVGASRDTGQLSVSDDGRYVAFLSSAKLTSASPRVTGSATSAYRKDLSTGAVTAIGSPSDIAEEQVSLSPDGSAATFTTAAPLVTGDTNTKPDAYRRDLASGALALVTSDASGAPTPSTTGAAYRGRVVDLGGSLVVVITVQALDAADTNGVRDAYLKDLASGGVTALVRP